MNERLRKILVVDDEPDLVASLCRILKYRGFEAASARDGREATEMNLSWQPDAVIMDVRMPRQNGIEACLEMQRARTNVLVILMTGFSDALDEANESIFAEADRRGRVEVMMKPLDLDRVMKLLRNQEQPSPAPTPSLNGSWLDAVQDASSSSGGRPSRTRVE